MFPRLRTNILGIAIIIACSTTMIVVGSLANDHTRTNFKYNIDAGVTEIAAEVMINCK